MNIPLIIMGFLLLIGIFYIFKLSREMRELYKRVGNNSGQNVNSYDSLNDFEDRILNNLETVNQNIINLNSEINVLNNGYSTLQNRVDNYYDPNSNDGSIYDTFRSVNAEELGYEVDNYGNIIFNKPVKFNNPVEIKNELNVPYFDNMIAPFAVDFNVPDAITDLQNKGWYLCDGSDYTLYNGSRFTAPNLRGRFIWGGIPESTYNDSSINTYSQTGGTRDETLEIGQIPSHNHGGNTGDDPDHKYNLEKADHPPDYFGHSTGNWSVGSEGHSVGGRNGGRYKHTHPINPEGGGESHNNLPPYMVLGYFIYKAGSNQI